MYPQPYPAMRFVMVSAGHGRSLRSVVQLKMRVLWLDINL